MAKVPPLLRAMTKITNVGDRINSKLLYPFTTKSGDSVLFVLKRDGTTKKFKILAEVTNYGMEFEDEFRNRTIFTYATLREDWGEDENKTFWQILQIATHVAQVPNGEVFSIRDDTGLQVAHTEFSYKIFGELKGDIFVKEENE